MTKASILSTLGEGNGLTDTKLVDAHYAARERHQRVGPFPAIVLLKPVEHKERDTARGTHRFVTYEIEMIEPETDPDEVGRLMYRMQNLYDGRTGNTEPRLPLDIPGAADEERRRATIEAIEAWADEQGWSVPDGIGQVWRDYWGIGADEEWSYGDRGVPANYRTSATAWLLEFAYEKKVLEPPAAVKEEQERLETDEEPDALDAAGGGDDVAEPEGETGEEPTDRDAAGPEFTG